MSDNAFPPAASDSAGDDGIGGSPHEQEMERLRELLMGDEIARIGDLEARLDDLGLSVEEVADLLPQAIAMSREKDQQLGESLMPTIEDAIGESVRKRPDEITNAIFPILGPAIRKSIAQALADLVANINRTIEHELSWQGIKWRVESLRTGVPYSQVIMKHALVFRVEQVFLIHRETGLLLHHVSPPDMETTDSDMVSGMLTAIRDFVQDSFAGGGEGELRTFAVGELTVFVEQGPYALMAAVVRGHPPDNLHVVLEEALESIHLSLSGLMKDFSGDTAPFDEAHHTLADCLRTEYATNEKSGGGFKTKLLIGWVVILFFVFWSGLVFVRSNQRWAEAQDALNQTPGIALVDASRFLGKWKFTELRDPLSLHPNSVLDSRGFDTTDVTHAWTSYISVEPEMVIARARVASGAPGGVEFSTNAGKLFVSGLATARWRDSAATTLRFVPGVSTVEWGRFNRNMPTSVRETAEQVESYVITFPSGSSIPVDGGASVGDAAADILALASEADRWGWNLAIEVAGRTDSTGAAEVNRTLSIARAERIRRDLLGFGVDSTRLKVIGLGNDSPMSLSGVEDLQSLNRSVTFVVTTTPMASSEEPR